VTTVSSAICSACRARTAIEEIEQRQDGTTALWCAACLLARQESERKAEIIKGIIQDFREDPALSLLEFATYAVRRHFER
jgi:hypothetical protein